MNNFSLAQILEIENDKALLRPVCLETKVSLWTTIRFPLLLLILQKLYYRKNSITNKNNQNLGSNGIINNVGAILKSVIHNKRFISSSKKEYQIVISATGARKSKVNGKYFNQLSDHFSRIHADETLVFEDLFEGQWPFPRVNKNVLLKTPFRAIGNISGRINSKKYSDEIRMMINVVVTRAKTILDIDISQDEVDGLFEQACRGAGSLKNRYDKYRFLFEKLKTRVFIKEEAMYGGADNAAALAAAKDLGIITAEYQHGTITRGHIAYNFAPVILKDAGYKRSLPDYFLTYGSWWSSQINAPSRKIDLGNPHRSSVVNKYPRDENVGNVVLVLGDGIETQQYLDFCYVLRAHLDPSWIVRFRPHPLERSCIQSHSPFDKYESIQIDGNDDIYASFLSSNIVISELSTGLFEAIGLVKRIFIWRTKKSEFGLPDHPFAEFRSMDELITLIDSGEKCCITNPIVDSFWSEDWEQNYREFIDGLLSGTPNI